MNLAMYFVVLFCRNDDDVPLRDIGERARAAAVLLEGKRIF